MSTSPALQSVRHVWYMQSFQARLFGMHRIAMSERAHTVLCFKRCRFVHTLRLYSAHAVLFLGSKGEILKGPLLMQPNRIYGCRQAVEVLEVPVWVLQLRQSVLEQELGSWRRCAQRR